MHVAFKLRNTFRISFDLYKTSRSEQAPNLPHTKTKEIRNLPGYEIEYMSFDLHFQVWRSSGQSCFLIDFPLLLHDILYSLVKFYSPFLVLFFPSLWTPHCSLASNEKKKKSWLRKQTRWAQNISNNKTYTPPKMPPIPFSLGIRRTKRLIWM